MQTIGQMLAAADAQFARTGGYKAAAHCEDRRVDLIHQAPDGTEAILSSARMPRGIAPEDVARDLLVAEIGDAQAEALYFVIDIL